MASASGERAGFHVGVGLLHSLERNWWLLLFRGLVSILFGFVAMFWPLATLVSLAILWGIYALADGIFALGAGIAGQGPPGSRWWLITVGLLGIVGGVAAMLLPGLTAQLLLMLIAVWAIAIGAAQVVGAIALRREIAGEWMLIASGLLCVLLGMMIFARPAAAAVAMLWTIGGFALIIGFCYVGLAVRLRLGHRRHFHGH